MQPGKAKALDAIIHAAQRGELDESTARQLHALGVEAVALAMLAVSKHIAELQRWSQTQAPSPSTPSGMVPIYAKANASKRRKKPGAKPGHEGVRRERPVNIDERKTHRLKCCPHCEGPLQRCERSRRRIIEDIPEVIEPVVTEHTIHRDYCPKCKRHVEPTGQRDHLVAERRLGHRVRYQGFTRRIRLSTLFLRTRMIATQDPPRVSGFWSRTPTMTRSARPPKC